MRIEVALSRDTSRPVFTYLRNPSAGSLFMEFVFISWQVILSKIFFSISGESSSSLLWSWLKWSDCQCIRHSGEGSSVGRWSVDKQELSHPGLVSVGFPRFAVWEASAFSAGNREEQFPLLFPQIQKDFHICFYYHVEPTSAHCDLHLSKLVMMIVTAYRTFPMCQALSIYAIICLRISV